MIPQSRNQAENNFIEFTKLYQKFKAGQKWLDARLAAGQETAKDTEDFTANVILPLNILWESFTAKEREGMEKVMQTYDALDGNKITFKPQQQEMLNV